MNWKKRRIDPAMERYWNKIASERKLNSWELYQQKWNFRETDYDHKPSKDHRDHGKALRADHKMEKHEDAEQYWRRVRESISMRK